MLEGGILTTINLSEQAEKKRMGEVGEAAPLGSIGVQVQRLAMETSYILSLCKAFCLSHAR